MTLRKMMLLSAGCGLMLLASAGQASAQSCPAAGNPGPYPSAAGAITSWEQQHRVILTPDARDVLLGTFCDAASDLQQTEGVGPAEIDAAAPAAIGQYLTDSASEAATTLDLKDLLAAQVSLGSTGSLPGPRALGRVRITYNHAVDALIAGGQQMPPYPLILARLGSLAISGTLQGQRVCSGQVTVIAATTASFAC